MTRDLRSSPKLALAMHGQREEASSVWDEAENFAAVHGG